MTYPIVSVEFKEYNSCIPKSLIEDILINKSTLNYPGIAEFILKDGEYKETGSFVYPGSSWRNSFKKGESFHIICHPK